MAEMMPQSALVPDSDYIIIGGTGDLLFGKFSRPFSGGFLTVM